MGLWWKSVKAEMPLDPAKYVRFEGDPKVLSKLIVIPWRRLQRWHFIKVERPGEFQGRRYHLFYSTETGKVMRFRRWLFSDYVAVRAGPWPRTFWATLECGTCLPLHNTYVTLPLSLTGDACDELKKSISPYLEKRSEFI